MKKAASTAPGFLVLKKALTNSSLEIRLIIAFLTGWVKTDFLISHGGKFHG